MPDKAQVSEVVARMQRGLPPERGEDELRCRCNGCASCERPNLACARDLGDGAMDGHCYLCAQQKRREGRWSTRNIPGM